MEHSPKINIKPDHTTVFYKDKTGEKKVYFTERNAQGQNVRITDDLNFGYVGKDHEMFHALSYQILSMCGLQLPKQTTLESEVLIIALEEPIDELIDFQRSLSDAVRPQDYTDLQRKYTKQLLENIVFTRQIFDIIHTNQHKVVSANVERLAMIPHEVVDEKSYIYKPQIPEIKITEEISMMIHSLQLKLLYSKTLFEQLNPKEKQGIFELF
jgi:hypothetical protein